jgi:inorganic pyrophosphatase
MTTLAYTTRTLGPANSLAHKVYLESSSSAGGGLVSPFHDVPLYANKEKTILNMVVEIPRWSNAKMEISKDQPFNPIVQDTKKGKLRFVRYVCVCVSYMFRNCFPHHGYIWNYGCFPQTWEDPTHSHPDTKCVGDNDPLDVCEIGEQVAYIGIICTSWCIHL